MGRNFPLWAPPIAEETYTRLIAAFRNHPPPAWKAAAKEAGCDPRTARKMWTLGSPAGKLEPIEKLFERERQRARAQIVETALARTTQEEQERERALQHAINARAQEGEMVELARGSALDALVASRALIQGAQLYAKRIAARLKRDAEQEERLEAEGVVPTDAKGEPIKIPSVGSQISLLSKVVDIMDRINSLAHRAMVMERMYLGEPSKIVELRGSIEVDLAEAQLRAEAAQQAIALARLAEEGGIMDTEGEALIGQRIE